MSAHRRTRRDSNHAAIVEQLRTRGYAVSDLAAVGGGCPDLLVSKHGTARLVEVKRDAKAARGAKRGSRQAAIQERQQAWRELHPGLVIVATSADDVDAAWSTPP